MVGQHLALSPEKRFEIFAEGGGNALAASRSTARAGLFPATTAATPAALRQGGLRKGFEKQAYWEPLRPVSSKR
jgi:hypothetical protein